MSHKIDIDIDWNEEDDTGLPWTFVDRAAQPDRIVAGTYVVAGRGSAVAVAEVIYRDENSVVHLRPLQGPVSRHTQLLSRGRSA